jgi:type IV pilus assembly protein PilY1
MAMSSMCATQAPGYMVIFGTGRYLGLSDLSNDHRQSIFGIWDYGDDCDDSEVPGILVDRDSGWLSSGLRLKKQVVAGEKTVGGSTYRELSANAIEYGMVEDSSDDDGFSGNNHGIDQKGNPDVYVGWFLDFPVPPGNERASAERVTGNVVIRGGHAVIVSHTPSGEPCGHGGESWLYILNGCDGSMPSAMEGEFVQPKRFRGRLNNNPIVIKDATQGLLDYLLIGDHKGNIHKIGFRGESLGKVYWRHDD